MVAPREFDSGWNESDEKSFSQRVAKNAGVVSRPEDAPFSMQVVTAVYLLAVEVQEVARKALVLAAATKQNTTELERILFDMVERIDECENTLWGDLLLVDCPLCDGQKTVCFDGGEPTACPACRGTGAMQRDAVRELRWEIVVEGVTGTEGGGDHV